MVLRRTRRFGLDDDEVAASVAGRATNQVTAAVGGAVSGSHHVLPQWSLHGAAHVEAGGGWVLGGSISRREYTDASVTIPTSITELYSGSFRFAYTFSRPRLHGDGVAHSHGVQVDLYYGSGDRGRLGVIASRGEEMESIGTSVSRTRVASYTLRGLHPLDHQWSLEWRVGRHRQGSHYTRRGAWLGLVLEF